MGNMKDAEGLQSAVSEARSHLGAALIQTIHSDDQIIAGHIREAYILLGGSQKNVDRWAEDSGKAGQ